MSAIAKKTARKKTIDPPVAGPEKPRTVRKLSGIHEITNAITSQLDLNKILEVVFRESKKIIRYDLASIDLLDKTGKISIVYFLEPTRRGKIKLGETFPLEGTGIEWVIKNKRALIRTDFSREMSYREDPYIRETGILSGIVIPLIYREKVIGTFNLGSKRKNSYHRKDERILGIIAGHIAIALENARIHKELRDHAQNLEAEVEERTKELQNNIENLQAAQVKLIQTEKLAATSKLVAGVAHEVKNPLSSISFAGSIIEKALETGTDLDQVRESCRESISIFKSEVIRLKNLLDRFIAFGQPTTTVREKTDINKVVRQAIQSLKWKLEEKKVQLVETYSDNLPEIQIDKDEFHRAIFNIIINSIHAIQPGGTIGVKTILEDGQITIEFEDDGCGIRSNIQDKIFDIFFTTKSQGSGMGLSQVYRTVESHNGSICLSSDVGKGTKLQIELPLPVHR